MVRYFFHVDDGRSRPDATGTTLASLTAAVQLMGEMLKDEGDGFWARPDITVTVTDADGLTLWVVCTSGIESPSVGVDLRPRP